MGNRDSFTQSKILAPAELPQALLRSRLLDRLEASSERLVILSATVGYGKTVLLTHYVHRAKSPCAWYHLAEPDNDRMVFMHCLRRSVQQAAPEFSFDEERYAAMEQDEGWLAAITYAFVEAFEALDGARLSIVLDDFQAVTSPMIYTILQTLLDSLPNGVRILIATKSAVPAFCARYILQGDALVLGQTELSFTDEEARAAIEPVANGADIDHLVESVMHSMEGWPAGIRFAILYLRQLQSAVSEPDYTALYNRNLVHDYIMHELFRKMPYELQQFLSMTSALDALSVNVCNAVMQRNDAQGTLAYLERENLFIIHTGDSDQHFRYHMIFREFLSQQLHPEVKLQVLERAARFYLKTSDKEQAVEYAIACDDSALVQFAMEAVGMFMLEQGKLETLSRWIDYLYSRSAQFTARIHLILGCYYHKTGDIVSARAHIEQAAEIFQAEGDDHGQISALLHKARLLRDQVSLESSCELIDSLLPRLKRKGSQLRFEAVLEKLYNLIHMARYTEALAICSEMILAARSVGNRKAEAVFTRFSAVVLFYLGEYARAADVYEESCRRSPPGQEGGKEFYSGAYIALIRIFQGDYAGGREMVDRELGLPVARVYQEDGWMAHLLRACVYAASYLWGDAQNSDSVHKEALDALHMAEHLSGNNRENPFFRRTVDIVGVIIHCCLNSGGNALEALLALTRGEGKGLQRELLTSCIAGVYHTRGNSRLARSYAEQCLRAGERETLFTAYGRTLLAKLRQDEGDLGGDADLQRTEDYVRRNRLRLPGQTALGVESRRNARVRCFGGFSLHMPGADSEVRWRTKKAQELFAYLFHQQGAPVERDQLLCRLWPEMPTENAVSLLHTTLYSIRKALGKSGLERIIEYRDKKYSLDMKLVDSDLNGAQALFRAMEQGNGHVVVENCGLLLEYGGEYMAGIDGRWVSAQREYIETMSLKCYKYIARCMMQEGEYEQALVWLKKYLEIDPYAEFIYEMLMQCYGGLGDIKNIKQCYATLCSVLMEELGVEPGKRAKQVYYGCLGKLGGAVVNI